MNLLITILTALLALDCLFLLLLILVQRGRGGGLAGAFGGMGGGESAFGTRAVSTAKKATAVLAAIFIILSAVLYRMRGRPQPAEEPAPGGPVQDSAPVEPPGK